MAESFPPRSGNYTAERIRDELEYAAFPTAPART